MFSRYVPSLRTAIVLVTSLAALPIVLRGHGSAASGAELFGSSAVYVIGWSLAAAMAFGLTRWLHRSAAEPLRRQLAVRAAWAVLGLVIAAVYVGVLG